MRDPELSLNSFKTKWKTHFFSWPPPGLHLSFNSFVVRANAIFYKLASASVCIELNWIEFNISMRPIQYLVFCCSEIFQESQRDEIGKTFDTLIGCELTNLECELENQLWYSSHIDIFKMLYIRLANLSQGYFCNIQRYPHHGARCKTFSKHFKYEKWLLVVWDSLRFKTILLNVCNKITIKVKWLWLCVTYRLRSQRLCILSYMCMCSSQSNCRRIRHAGKVNLSIHRFLKKTES